MSDYDVCLSVRNGHSVRHSHNLPQLPSTIWSPTNLRNTRSVSFLWLLFSLSCFIVFRSYRSAALTSMEDVIVHLWQQRIDSKLSVHVTTSLTSLRSSMSMVDPVTTWVLETMSRTTNNDGLVCRFCRSWNFHHHSYRDNMQPICQICWSTLHFFHLHKIRIRSERTSVL